MFEPPVSNECKKLLKQFASINFPFKYEANAITTESFIST